VATSEVDIINEALLLAGQKETIESRGDDTAPAEIADKLYDRARDKVLAAAPWPFARKRATLALTVETRTEWKNVYALPSDYISARRISNGARPGQRAFASSSNGTFPAGWADWPRQGLVVDEIPFAIESAADGNSQVLLTDQDAAELVYTARISTTMAYPPLFEEALILFLAWRFCFALPVKASLALELRKAYDAQVLKGLAEAFRSEREDGEADARYISVRG
jgi:hypothetical protein